MTKSRLEAFSDGVLAIIITIMVLELKIPKGVELSDLSALCPILLSYALSFIYVGIYWNNHHHLFQAVHKINGSIMWANLHLLFWLSLVPLATAWLGQNYQAQWPVAIYGVTLLLPGVAFTILTHSLVRSEGKDSAVARALGKDLKGKASLVIYILGILGSFIHIGLSLFAYMSVAFMWLIPDPRIEKVLES